MKRCLEEKDREWYDRTAKSKYRYSLRVDRWLYCTHLTAARLSSDSAVSSRDPHQYFRRSRDLALIDPGKAVRLRGGPPSGEEANSPISLLFLARFSDDDVTSGSDGSHCLSALAPSAASRGLRSRSLSSFALSDALTCSRYLASISTSFPSLGGDAVFVKERRPAVGGPSGASAAALAFWVLLALLPAVTVEVAFFPAKSCCVTDCYITQ